MRLVIDTNILISALLSDRSLPSHLIVLWRAGRFDLLTSVEQVDELMRVTRYPKIRQRLPPTLAGQLINEPRNIAILVSDLPTVTVSPDPNDNYPLAMAAVGGANFLVTGDKRDVLALNVYAGTKIITVRDFLILHGRMPSGVQSQQATPCRDQLIHCPSPPAFANPLQSRD